MKPAAFALFQSPQNCAGGDGSIPAQNLRLLQQDVADPDAGLTDAHTVEWQQAADGGTALWVAWTAGDQGARPGTETLSRFEELQNQDCPRHF
jgi:hypothetical protein